MSPQDSPKARVNSSRPIALLVAALGLMGCPSTQTAPTPATGGTTQSSKQTEKPWFNAAKVTPTPSAADLTAPVNAAMMMCSQMLNLTPCGLVTSGPNDVLACFAGCQSQIELVVDLLVEKAAQDCAAAPKEGVPVACALHFPEGAMVDAKALGKLCDDRCDELLAQAP